MLYPESFSSGSAAGDGDCGQRRYRCYCYGRLSKEDGDKPESGSIKNQRDLLHDFLARRPDLELVMEGYDDGYTGTNFSRPYFIQMLKAIEDGTVNCVVVKDLSRFGREYIEAGQYLEKLFPAYGVRFISVSDGYDSLHSTASDGLMVPFKNLINDAYCRDTSLKIRSHFDVKRKKGQFIGAFAPYGYQKDPQDKNRLIPDEPAAAVVRRIFTWYTAGGMSKAAIAKQLNFLGIPNPSAYKRQQGLRYCNPAVQENSRLWTPGSVGYLLSNPVYNGTMVQGRQKILSYKLPQAIQMPKECWFVVEHTHPPLISQPIFDAAQARKRQRDFPCSKTGSIPLFSGLVRCASCGKAMMRHSAKGYRYYCCRTQREAGGCTRRSIRADRLEGAVLLTLQLLLQCLTPLARLQQELTQAAAQQSAATLTLQLERKHKELCHLQFLTDSLYPDWKDGHLTSAEYHRLKADYCEQMDACQKFIDAIAAQAACPVLPEDLSKAAHDAPDASALLDRGLLLKLVDSIKVHSQKELSIQLRFFDPFQSDTTV